MRMLKMNEDGGGALGGPYPLGDATVREGHSYSTLHDPSSGGPPGGEPLKTHWVETREASLHNVWFYQNISDAPPPPP